MGVLLFGNISLNQIETPGKERTAVSDEISNTADDTAAKAKGLTHRTMADWNLPLDGLNSEKNTVIIRIDDIIKFNPYTGWRTSSWLFIMPTDNIKITIAHKAGSAKEVIKLDFSEFFAVSFNVKINGPLILYR